MAETAASPRRLPWLAAATALTAFVAIGVSSNQYVLSAVWTLAVLGSYVFERRLTRGSPGFWTLNLLVLTSVLLTLLLSDDTSISFIDSSALMSGELSAAIIALQFWSWPPYAGERGVLPIGLSALVFLAASWRLDNHFFMAIIAPIYMALFIPALRQVRKRAQSRGLSLLHFSALAIVLAFGAGSALEVRNHRSDITVWFMRLITPKGRNEGIGISQVPVLGATSNLQLSPQRILRLSGPLPDRHLRGITFDTYVNGKWGPSIYGREFKPIPGPDLAPVATTEPNLEITRLVDDFRLLVAPLHAAGVVLPRRQIEWCPDFGGPMRTGVWLVPPLTYQVLQSRDESYQGPLCVKLTERAHARCLAIPEQMDPRVRELALHVVGDETDPAARVRLIVNYLKTNHSYSLTTDPGEGDPLTNFILERKSAHCEYFASAAVILLRCAGVPTRYVAGYYAHEAGLGGSLIVRQRDGHAWAESWVEGTGWITVDATPDNGRPDLAAAPIPWWMALWEWIQDRWTEFRTWAGDLSAMQQAEIVLVLAALAIALQWIRAIRKKRRHAANDVSYLFPDAALAELAGRFERLLNDQNIPCPSHRTWVEHLATVAQNPSLSHGFDLTLAAEFARHFSRIRFGKPDDRAAIAELAREMAQLSSSRKTREQS